MTVNYNDFLAWLKQRQQQVTDKQLDLFKQFFTDGVLDMLSADDPELLVQTTLLNYLSARGVAVVRPTNTPDKWAQYALQMALLCRPDRATTHELMQLLMNCVMLKARGNAMDVAEDQKQQVQALLMRTLDLAVDAATRMLLVDKYSEEALAKVTHQQPRQVM